MPDWTTACRCVDPAERGKLLGCSDVRGLGVVLRLRDSYCFTNREGRHTAKSQGVKASHSESIGYDESEFQS